MNKWDEFFVIKIKKIFQEKKDILDIGNGLRVIKEKGNRYDSKREWLRPLIEKSNYKIMDPVPDYNPDVIGDVHKMPFADGSFDAVICIAVLEHVENPFKAAQEIYRVLKLGGYVFAYVPFLFYYHAEKGYYKDYWRFSKDAINLIFKDFSVIEIQGVRGALETWVKLSPLGRYNIFLAGASFFDKVFNKMNTKQTSGYNIFLVK